MQARHSMVVQRQALSSSPAIHPISNLYPVRQRAPTSSPTAPRYSFCMPRRSSDEKPPMADEHTPLIAVVQTRPARDRYPHHTLRYICTLLLSATLFLGLAAVILILNFSKSTEDDNAGASVDWSVYVPFAHDVPASWPKSAGLEYSDLQEILSTTPDAEKAREWSQYYTSGPHLAGKNLSQAIWTKEKWQEFGIENSLIVDYDLYLNYPKGHRLALLEKNNDSGRDDAAEVDNVESWKIAFEASLEEDVLEEDGTSGLQDRIPTFHGYSASGNVTAPYVFVNYGTYKDFQELVAANISLAGKIALVKYGGIFRGLKVKRAQELGMVGVVMYSDPGDDGEVTEANGNATYPDGPARAPSSVQRGSCQFLSKYITSCMVALLIMYRLCPWRSYNSWLSLKTRRAPSTCRPRNPIHSIPAHFLRRCVTSSQSPQWPRPESIILQQILERWRLGIQGRGIQHRTFP
jgi:hypothetical protein